MTRQWQRWTARGVATVLAMSIVVAVDSSAGAAPDYANPQRDKSVPVKTGKATKAPAADPTSQTIKSLPDPKWPAAGSATVTLPTVDASARAAAPKAQQVGKLPVFVAPVASTATDPALRAAAAGPKRIKVDLLDRAATEKAGVTGLALRVKAEEGSGPASVSVDYGDFAGGFGGDYAARLRVVPLPECALSTPEKEECQPGDPLPGRNDTKNRRVTAEVQTTGAGTMLALAAGASGAAGDYTATPLAPSAAWQVSPQTGDFSWSYDIEVPPALNGPQPDLGITYSSQSVDGRTAATNAQPTWVGEGFDLGGGGSVERSYVPCSDDGSAGSPKRGDLCFTYENATMTLGGKTTELVKDDATGKWRPKNDDGSRIDLLTNATNGDNNGEHWRITTGDGTQYFFGLNRLPGWTGTATPETESTWTVPVYGNNPGEQCYNATFTSAMCVQAWRWNLDYVVDPRGNAMAYFYDKYLNHYARNRSTATSYVRGGTLKEIRYGLRSNAVYAQAPMMVKFDTAERCLPEGTITCSDAQFTTANARYWPDTPVDQNCKAGAACTGQISPTFWSRKRLTAVSTFVWGGSAYRPVDTWTLRQSFPRSDSSTPGLWLEGITHTGKVAGRMGSSETLPETTFGGAQLPNRVDGVEGIAPMVKYRLRTISSESGGVTSVNYSEPECAVGALPEPDKNTKRCYPTFWTPDGATAPVKDWFHKYVATSVVDDDRVEGTPDVVTSYEYVDLPAWHFDDDDGLTKAKHKTWSQWRGYGHVKVRKGATTEQRSEIEYRYFRGMNGDKQSTGPARAASVVDSENTSVVDEPWLQGFVREEIERLGPNGAEVSAKINDPWLRGPTATRVRAWGTTNSYVLNTSSVRTRVPLKSGGFRRTESRSTFTNEGLIAQIDELGDTGVTGDETCTRNTYVRNETAWMISLPSRVEVVSVGCGTPPSRPSQVISDERTHYDGLPFGATPTRGLPTRSEELGDDNTYKLADRNVYDAYGRVTEQYDALEVMTKITYTPATGPVTKVTTKNALNQETWAELDPAWGDPTATVDPSGKRTEKVYDPLGRIRKVWLPGQPTTGPASEEYEYLVRKDGPVVITTKELRNDGTAYNTSYELFDGLLRPRQRQTPAPGGGRVLVDTFYDSRGQEVKETSPYFNDQPPGTNLALVVDAQVPGLQETVIDGAGRPTAQIFKVLGQEKWRTTTTYDGDRLTVDPPDGETATTSLLDAEGRTTELWQHKTGTPTGDANKTFYTYTPEGELKTVTDPAGNVRTFDYDVRGRLKTTTDPNSGTTTYTYDEEGRLTSTTTGGRTLTYKFDVLDRVTETWEGSTKLTSYVYDTLVPGELTSSTRYVNGNAYTSAITGYDDADRPLGSTITIPESEGKLAGTYSFGSGYNIDGTVAKTVYPAAGGLPAETVRHEYTELGLPTTTKGLTDYVVESGYSKLGEPNRVVFSTGSKVAVRTFAYEEGTRRLKNVITEKDGAQRIGDISYDYDEAGNIIRTSDKPPNVTADNECFRYDHLQRLTEAWTPASGDCGVTPTSQALGGPAPYWQSYTYDEAGNRKEEVRRNRNSELRRSYTTPTAGPDSRQPNTVTSVTNNQGGATTTDTFAYDSLGNTKQRVVGGKTQTLDWSIEGSLDKVTEGDKVTSFVYDASGERLIRKEPGATTLYLGGMELKVSGDQTTAVRYYQHGGEKVAVRNSSSVSFMFGDHHDTEEILLNADTMAVTQRRFDPFGQLRGTNPDNWVGERSFVGGTADQSTGLIHLGAREYDATMGRFISLDPVVDHQDPQQLHGYAYANNSPETFSDPDGLWGFRCGWCERAREKARNAWNRTVSWASSNYRRYAPVVRKWVTKQVDRVKKVAKSIKRAVVKKVKSWTRSVKKWAGKQVNKVKKHFRAMKDSVKRFRKTVKEGFKKGLKKTWEGTKKTGKWLKNNVGPGTKGWTFLKIGLGVAAMFVCTVCAIAGYAAMAMTAVDIVGNAKEGNWRDVVYDAVGFLPVLGLANKVKGFANAARADAAMGAGVRSAQLNRVAQARAQTATNVEKGFELAQIGHFVNGSFKDLDKDWNGK